MNETPTTTRKIKLLIADDHPSFRQMMRRFFPEEEIEIIECADGSEAVARFGEVQPDWVLMDFEMEPMDGLSATRAILSRFPDARILMVTYRDDADLRAATREAGADGFVLKENLLEVRERIITSMVMVVSLASVLMAWA